MRHVRLLLPFALLLLASTLGVSRLAAQEATPVIEPDTLVLVERNEHTETIDAGEPGPSAGDLLVWGPNTLYDASNETDTGATMYGECVWLTSEGHQQCSITFVFPDGSLITAQGVQHEGQPSVTVITGGTGQYLGVTGRLISEPNAEGSAFTQTFEFGR